VLLYVYGNLIGKHLEPDTDIETDDTDLAEELDE
jgi:hypothetical protein